MKDKEKTIVSRLRKRGYKLTPQRQAVLTAIANSQKHLTPAAIYARVRKEYPTIGLVTIYRTLGILTELGLICQMSTKGNSRSYLLRRVPEHHHHLICSFCGTVVDFTKCDLNGLEQRLARETGFKIDYHLLEFTGCCQNCQKTAPL